MKFSKIMLGTVQFGLNYGINNSTGQPSRDTVKAILRAAADGGINVLDTARNYGESEEVLGLALKECGLDKHFYIISKVKLFPENISASAVPAWINSSVETSLKYLKRDCLDGLLMHHEKDLPYLDCMNEMLTKKYTSAVGASLDSVAGSPTEYVDKLVMAQVPGNILDRRFFEKARKIKSRGGSVFCRSVYLQGLLFKPEADLQEKFAPLLRVRQKLEKLSSEAGIIPAELYFRYLLSQDMFDCILCGVETVEQLEENLRVAGKGALPADLLEAVENIVPELEEKYVRPSSWSTL